MKLPPLYPCEFCGVAVDIAAKDIGLRVEGWVENRKGAPVHRRSTPHGWACPDCFYDLAHGLTPGTNVTPVALF